MENELLEISKDFKDRIKKKNIQIAKLKKLICVLYGLVVITDEEEDTSLIGIMRSKLSNALSDHMGVESDEEDDGEVRIIEMDLGNIDLE
tara:strand:+ start:73 stop:342 length:270 start_codon:yes stop_codon:yes gene_type:complete